MHKIIFICGCLEEGKDGIGDYTRKLAAQCEKNGIEPALVSLYDAYVDADWEAPNILRISKFQNNNARQIKVLQFIKQFRPDWISLQFMPYAFHGKGIVWDQIPLLKRITSGHKLQMMFHELWIGEEAGATLKKKLLGKFQKYAIHRLIKILKPLVLHTSIPLYQLLLERLGFKAGLLPLFGNIKIQENPTHSWIYNEMGLTCDIKPENRNDFLVFGIFGTWYSNWDLESLFDKINADPDISNKNILIASIGHSGSDLSRWEALSANHPEAKVVILGRKSEKEVSEFLQFIDFGIATTPLILLGKSGSYLALIEHGVPVLCDINKIKFNFATSSLGYWEGNPIVIGKQPINFTKSMIRSKPNSQAEIIAGKFIHELGKI